ncbi:MAG: SDR family NAD(P)-dependent oxidoreductase [Anaerolineaceae bacterium]|nr:SDR family NAD(P)-dependent oxidoreductase [Anaerolineaceae bacterium]
MKLKTALTTFGLGMLAYKLVRQPREESLAGEVALITGGSRGLGYLLAQEFAREGCRLAICARDATELARAQRSLARHGAEVLAIPCDVGDHEQVRQLIDETTRHYGRIDILVNNAGIIQVGPAEEMDIADFKQAMDIMYWAILYATWAVLPQMQQRGYGRIVNITSIGGRVSVPHLLPYNSAKFAAVGLSEGLRAELAGDGIQVTTIVPGLMRTGSHLHAHFKGDQEKEFTWFSLGASLPVISMDARRAARQIVAATRRSEAERVLSWPASLLANFHGLFPALTTDILTVVNNLLLPEPQLGETAVQKGLAVQKQLSPLRAQVLALLTTLGQQAAQRYLQLPASQKRS